MYSDDDCAALYDRLNPWDPDQWAGDAFYHELVMAAGSVLDVGCGTGAMLHLARERGHRGRLVGVDPDPAPLRRAARRADVEWVAARADELGLRGEFELAVMTGHAFQFLVTDEELRASLRAVRAALRPGGRFAFETRHPQARAWEGWHPAAVAEVIDAAGRELRSWYEVESVLDGVVTFTGTLASAAGEVLRVDRTGLRFLAEPELDALLAEAGFTVEARYGDWARGPVTGESTELVTVARVGA
ncbi:class I SAM-dependent methyltransferase [Kitasatospora sp. NPDC058965]|uniref:class I SAM-dependent methyltransferase n=1 Tax=Kitasatospora sp. NPDC058965 TaxID=3346682 RepID=UPI003698D8E9